MMAGNEWFNQYQQMTPSETVTPVDNADSGAYIISTEFFRANGDNIEIYMFPEANGMTRMEDAGITVDLIATSGVDIHDRQIATELGQIAHNEAVKIDCGILYVNVADDLSAVIDGKQQLLRAIIAISNRFAV